MTNEETEHWILRVKRLAEGPDPNQAVEQIDELRESFEKVCLIAEAGMRTLLGALDPLPLADEPQWLINAARDVDVRAANPAAIESARYLCRALLVVRGDLTAEWDVAPHSAIEVTWNVLSRLTWIVRAPRHRWPGVVVRSYVFEKGSARMRVCSSMLAQRVIKIAQKEI
jgi:hypothetical protein